MVSEKSAAWDAMMADHMRPPWRQYSLSSSVSLSLTDFAPECDFPVEGARGAARPRQELKLEKLNEISECGIVDANDSSRVFE